MKLILGGHWVKAPDGWTALSEKEQDITRRLRWQDNSVDAIFTEHVIEHITFLSAVGFMREALRVLKPGGTFRVVAPMVDVFAAAAERERKDWMGRYAREQMAPYYQSEVAELGKLGLSLETDMQPWLINFLATKHGHKFCWSGPLMVAVLRAVGFSAAGVFTPGVSMFDQTTCLERRIRGTHGENLEKEFGPGIIFDPESGVVEARK